MELFLDLYIGHLLGDFLLQPGWLVAAKRRGLAGVLLHAGIIVSCTAVILFSVLAQLWWMVLLAAAAHIVIEIATISLRQHTRVAGVWVFLFDQVLHVSSLVVLVLLARDVLADLSVETLGLVIDAPTLALVTGSLFVMLFGAIFSFEVENALSPAENQREILPFDLPRVLGMAERGLALLLATLVNPALAVAPFIPRLARAIGGTGRAKRHHTIEAFAGLTLVLISYAFVLFVRTVS